MDAPPPRPRAAPHSTTFTEPDEQSYSSDSASSAASTNTLRASPSQTPGPYHWTNYFTTELHLPADLPNGQHAIYHVYITPPTNPTTDPLFVCHHGAGASALSFASFASQLRALLPNAGILSLEAIGHGSTTKTLPSSNTPAPADYSLDTLTLDALTALQSTQSHFSWPRLPPLVLLGHSLGGAVLTSLANTHWRALSTLIGYAVLDVVEGSALEALAHMKTYLASRPSSFPSLSSAVDWHVRSRTIRDRASAEASVPSLLTPSPTNPESYIWRTDLHATEGWWEAWFQGLSSKFLTGRAAKMLILAGTDRLDRELMIGQMQGKFQLVVVPEAGHFVQEDVPGKVAELMAEFFKRNDRSQMVLPPKVSDLLAQGKKV